MSAAMICKGIPVLFMLTGHLDCKDVSATPDPQRVVCSGPSVPLLTIEESTQTLPKVRRFMNKVKRNRKDNHCPETVKP